MIIVDSSVWFDLFTLNSSRRDLARKFFKEVESLNLIILEPKVFEIEFVALLSRRYGKSRTISILNVIKEKTVILPNPDKIAFNIALNTGCRAIDSYFIATAKVTSSILITNDRIMADNAKKAEIEAYYLIEDFDRAVGRLKEIK